MSECPFRERPVVRYIGFVRPTLISCPQCGRCQVDDLLDIALEVERRINTLNTPAKVAVMGCVVNGPGEAREADIGVACGRGKAVLFQKGQKVKTIPTDRIIDEILERLPYIVVDSPVESTRWLCWCDMKSECTLPPAGNHPCFSPKERDKYRQNCPHRRSC